MRFVVLLTGLCLFACYSSAQYAGESFDERMARIRHQDEQAAQDRKIRAAKAAAERANARAFRAEESAAQLAERVAALEAEKQREQVAAAELARKKRLEQEAQAQALASTLEHMKLVDARERAAARAPDLSAPPTVAKRVLPDGRITVIVDGKQHTVATEKEIGPLIEAAAAARAARLASARNP